MEALTVPEEIEDACRQLAAISIISDVMPVGAATEEEMRYNENRFLLKDGIERIRNHPFKNLEIFLKVCGVENAKIDEKDFGFTVAPILNSTGRLETAKTGVEILTEEDEENVKMNAGYAVYLNTERKNLTAEAMSRISNDETSAAAVELVNAPAGIVGIIAGHISKAFDKPAVVFARRVSDDGRNVLVGSARSNGVSLYDAFKDMDQSLFVAYGGHALAAGVTIMEDNFDEFKKQFSKICLDHRSNEEKELSVVFTTFKDLEDRKTIEEIKNLKPFGNGFPAPEFLVDFDLFRVDAFFKSSHASISDKFGHQLWLYGQLNNGLDIASQNSFVKVGDNTAKRMKGDAERGVAPMSEEDAIAGHWERWEGTPAKYQVLIEANWGYFMNPEGGLQVSPILYQKYEEA
jgi:single-stranded-DNA-specific exonuclease